MSYSATVLADSPASYLRFGDAGGTTAPVDSGSAGYTWGPGTDSAPTFGTTGLLSGDADTAATFNGTSQALASTHANPSWTAITVEAWIKPSAAGNNQAIASSLDAGWLFQISSGALDFFNDTNNEVVHSSAITYSAGDTLHVAITFDASKNYVFYVNGLAHGSGTASFALLSNANLYVGRFTPGTRYFPGVIDELAVYGTALSGARILAHYNAGTAADTTPPTITGAAIGTAGTTLVWTASEAITAGAGGSGGVTLSATNGAVTATYASGSGTTTITYNLSRTIGHGETVTDTYVQPGNGWEDAAGNDLASFSGAAVTNNSNRPAAPTSLAVAGVTASSVNLTWTDNADNETAFVVEYDTVNTFDQGPVDVTLNTGDVQSDTVLTLAASTTYYFRVKATNANGSSNWSNVVSGTTSAVGNSGGASPNRLSLSLGLGL